MHLPEFEALGLALPCLEALAHEGYEHPTPIQTAAIPHLLAGRDLLGCAQTGTGKTAAFALPTIQFLMKPGVRRENRKVRALVVAPTRELAIQIDSSFGAYGRSAGLKRACVYGGVGKAPQIRALERGVDVLVATPGRLLDLAGERFVDLSAVEIAVLDEADRMLDMGFIHDVKRIMAMLPKNRQTLLFSATMPTEIVDLANSFLRNPVRVDIDPEKPAVECIDQTLYYVEKGEKRELLVHLIKEQKIQRALVFSKTKHGADRIAKSLHLAGIPAGVIHANKGQGNRTRTMDAFRSGETPILVATDIAARGIDVDDITHIFNFDQPTEPETYVHRIGRTARAGASGTAISFCDTEEKKFLRQVERLLGRPIPVVKEHPYMRGSGRETAPDIDDEHDRSRQPGRKEGQGRFQGRGARQGRPTTQSSRPSVGRDGRGSPAGESRRNTAPAVQSGRRSAANEPRRDSRPGPVPVRQRNTPVSRPDNDERKPTARTGESNRNSRAPAASRDVRSAIDELTGRSSSLGR
ncbi:MAG: DEAD/DEAH box helicase [Spirochaetales bacterium]|nr:MAG: DEAD/DEAH box helicase [Spirochaetales bacterium]